MKNLIAAATAALLLAPAAFAESHATGNAEAGEDVFKRCRSCHAIQTADGETIQRGGKTGPDLWGVIGRTAGSADGFRYSNSMIEAGEAGLVWNEENFIAYVADPTGFLRTYLDSGSARGKMTFKLGDATDAADVWAYIASVSPAPEM